MFSPLCHNKRDAIFRTGVADTFLKVINSFVYSNSAHIDTPVAWAKGSRYMSALEVHRHTKGRVEVDVTHALHFKHLKPDDSGTYYCWYHGKKKAGFNLTGISLSFNTLCGKILMDTHELLYVLCPTAFCFSANRKFCCVILNIHLDFFQGDKWTFVLYRLSACD